LRNQGTLLRHVQGGSRHPYPDKKEGDHRGKNDGQQCLAGNLVPVALRGVNIDIYKVLKLMSLTQRFSFTA
jgi:hypothetical protein